MSKTTKITDRKDISQIAENLSQSSPFDRELRDKVASIIEDIKQNGDSSVKKFTEQFDNFNPENLSFRKTEIETAYNNTSQELIEALEKSFQRVSDYHQKQLPSNLFYKDAENVSLGWKYYPLNSVGLYVPGSLASYPSSVIMTAAIAKVAGVKRIAIACPTPNNQYNDTVLAACKICGVDEIYRIGGVQAIAALAYGTQSITKVNKIFGPGNKFVAEAKRQVFGSVGIDMIAGPSEILVISDNKSNPKWIARDLLSQAEHDPDATSILVTDDEDFAKQVESEIDNYIKTTSRKEITKASWENNGRIFLVEKLDDLGIEIANIIAPEHLELAIDNPEYFAERITTAGAIFMGRYTPEAIGDYMAGPSHVLPTSGTSSFSSGLSVFDFLRRSSLIECDKDSIKNLSKATIDLAESENLPCHADSVRIRDE